MQPGSAFLLMSRAAVVDFPAFLDAVRSGRIRAATDVFPEEPVAADDPVRGIEGLLLSAHRTGGTREALFEIGRLTVADAELVLRGLPPRHVPPRRPGGRGPVAQQARRRDLAPGRFGR